MPSNRSSRRADGILTSVSRENVEIVRQIFVDFNATQSLPDEVAADFVWDMSTFQGWPGAQKYRGRDAFMEFFKSWVSPYDDWSQEVERAEDLGGNQVLLVVRQYARPRGSNARVELRYGLVYTVEGGLARGARVYATPQEALEAVGLRE